MQSSKYHFDKHTSLYLRVEFEFESELGNVKQRKMTE